MNIVLTGHGHFGTGLKSCIETVIGSTEIQAFDFDDQITFDGFKNAVSILDNTKKYIVFCDLIGGTPFKTFSEYAFKNRNAHVFAGIPVAQIIELYLEKEELSFDDINDTFVTNGYQSMIMLDLKPAPLVLNPHENHDDLGGI